MSYLRLVFFGIMAAATGDAKAPAIPPLSSDDVSWLFPAPTRAVAFDNLISMGDLATQNSQDPSKRDPIWPDAAFRQFLSIAAGPAGGIGLSAEAQSMAAWFIAGIRMDAGAPGLSKDIRKQFGQSPEIRLIIQLVTRNPDGTPKVNDIAGHLIFDFVLGQDNPAEAGCFPRPKPDLAAFKAIVAELAALRTKLSVGQLGANRVTTSGLPLSVHPGLMDATTAGNLRQEMKSFLERHLSGQRLDSMAIVGVPAAAPAPWIFLSMLKLPPGVSPALPNGGFVPVHGPTLDGQQFAEMLQRVGTIPGVVPEPRTDNLHSITCRNAAVSPASLPVTSRRGLSTSELFVSPPPADTKTGKIINLIDNPAKSHFFNTDCVSCHTETRRAMTLLKTKDISGIDPAALPKSDWVVRNFGWSPGNGAQATATRRTAAETAAVVAFINSQLLNK